MTAAASSALSAHVEDLCRRARPAAATVAILPDVQRQAALHAAADSLSAHADAIRLANAKDVAQARADGQSSALVDRLRLDGERLDHVIADLRAVAGLADPVGRVLAEFPIAQGVLTQKIAIPIGVVACIFESRPNVTVDVAGLCLRAGNACILRGGKEAVHSNRALASAFRAGLEQAGFPADAVQLVQDQDRELIPLLLAREDAIDIVIPRGGESLIRAVVACSKVPVVKHDKGVCSVYVHAAADLAMAERIVLNAKAQRPGVCNAIENLLVDRAIAAVALPRLGAALHAAGVELRGDPEALTHLPAGSVAAHDADWDTEY